MLMRPPLTASRPASIRSAVVLPHPDGPTRTTNSPLAISSERSSTATTGPNRLLTWSKLTEATGYPFNDPASMPRRNWRWSSTYRITTGAATKTAAADTPGMSTP